MEGDSAPTVEAVRGMWDEATALYGRGDFDAAARRFSMFAEHANRLANLLTATLIPLGHVDTSASEFDPREYNRLVRVETYANDLKSQRNMAYVMVAECREQLGEKSAALDAFVEAFNLVGGGRLDAEAWKRAREGLFRIVKYQD